MGAVETLRREGRERFRPVGADWFARAIAAEAFAWAEGSAASAGAVTNLSEGSWPDEVRVNENVCRV